MLLNVLYGTNGPSMARYSDMALIKNRNIVFQSLHTTPKSNIKENPLANVDITDSGVTCQTGQQYVECPAGPAAPTVLQQVTARVTGGRYNAYTDIQLLSRLLLNIYLKIFHY